MSSARVLLPAAGEGVAGTAAVVRQMPVLGLCPQATDLESMMLWVPPLAVANQLEQA